MQESQEQAPLRVPPHVPSERVFDIDMYRPEGIDEGYLEAWTRLHEAGIPDLIWTPRNGGHWIATTGSLISAIYKDPERYSSQVLFIPKAAGEKYAMVPSKMDPPEHRPYREVVNQGLNLKAIREREPAIRAIAVELMDAFALRGSCDFVEEFSAQFPIRVFMMMADLPMTDAPKLRALASAMTRPDGNTPEEMAEHLDAANRGFFEYVSPIIDARAGKGGGDLISLAIDARIDGAPIDRDKLLGMISLLLLAGLDSVTNFLNMVMDHLARHPEPRRQLAADPAAARLAVEECSAGFHSLPPPGWWLPISNAAALLSSKGKWSCFLPPFPAPMRAGTPSPGSSTSRGEVLPIRLSAKDLTAVQDFTSPGSRPPSCWRNGSSEFRSFGPVTVPGRATSPALSRRSRRSNCNGDNQQRSNHAGHRLRCLWSSR